MRFVLTLFISLLFFSVQVNAQDFYDDLAYDRALVLSIDNLAKSDATTEENFVQTTFTLKILSGPFEGSEKQVIFLGKDTMPAYTKYQVGDTIFISYSPFGMETGDDEYITLYDIDNSFGIALMLILLTITIIGIGRIKGFLSLIALILTIIMIFIIFIPLTLKGYPPLFNALLISLISIVVTIPIITGLSQKSLAAVCGATIGIVVAAILAIICGWSMHLAGMISNETIKVFYMAEHQINLRDLALSGMIIAALGAIMDVAVSISSATAEIFEAHPNIEFKQALVSVMTIGKDILGSMINTLILAYVGSSLSLILIIYIKFNATMPLAMIFSHNPVLIEIVKSFVGSLGMFITIPATAFIAVKLYYKRARQKE